MRFKLDLKKKWKGFLNRSSEYRMSVLYGLIGLVCFCLAFYGFVTMSLTYKNVESSFMIETIEQLRAVGFATMICLFSGILMVAAIYCWLGMVVLLLLDQSGRVKKIEEFLEEDDVLSFRKDKD